MWLLIQTPRNIKMKLTKVKLRQVIMEELQKAAANPFGTGMEQLGTGDPKEIVGHT